MTIKEFNFDRIGSDLYESIICHNWAKWLFVSADAHMQPNQWIAYFTSTENRHALPLFTSLLNTVCAYDPVGYGVPYNHLMFSDSREPLVEACLQVLCVTIDNDPTGAIADQAAGNPAPPEAPPSEVCRAIFDGYKKWALCW